LINTLRKCFKKWKITNLQLTFVIISGGEKNWRERERERERRRKKMSFCLIPKGLNFQSSNHSWIGICFFILPSLVLVFKNIGNQRTSSSGLFKKPQRTDSSHVIT
jgi:hypothetical protein